LKRDREFGEALAHDVVYVGLHGDGHVGRLNLTFGSYLARGRDRGADAGGTRRARLVRRPRGVGRLRLASHQCLGLYASGDSDPLDDESGDFDFVRDRPRVGGIEDGSSSVNRFPCSATPATSAMVCCWSAAMASSHRCARAAIATLRAP